MKRVLAILSTALVLILLGLALWRRYGPKESAALPRLAFTAPAVAEVYNPGKARSIEVYDAAGRLVARAEAFGRPVVEVRFAWEPGAEYRVVADGGAGASVRAPQTVPQIVVRLHAPLGQTPYEYPLTSAGGRSPTEEIPVPAAPGETIDLMLEVERLTDGEPLVLQLSSELDPLCAGGLRLEPPLEAEEVPLEFEFDKQVWTSRVHLGPQLPSKPLVIALRLQEGASVLLSAAIRFVGRTLDREGLSVSAWRLPTERDGFHERQRVADRVVIPNRVWVHVSSWLGVPPAMPSAYEPFTYQAVWIRNATAQPASLLLASEVLHPETGQPVEFFATPEFESSGGTGRILAYSHVEPGRTQPCVLPVYVRPDTPEGTYLRRVEITPLGSDRPLAVLEAPLGVVRSDPLFSLWVAGAGALSLGWLAAAAALYRRMVRSLGVRVLVLLALLGSLQFCLQFAGGLVSMVFYALLGPFNCLVGGLLTEVMTYLLVTSILFLVPRVGAMTLAGLITYVMGGVLFGSFGLTDVLFVGSAIAFREALLFGFGVTRFTAAASKPPRLVPMMLALGLADAASTFTSLALQAVFYRLYFAPWYVLLQVGVTGFLYTALGVYLGRPLGASLRKVHQ